MLDSEVKVGIKVRCIYSTAKSSNVIGTICEVDRYTTNNKVKYFCVDWDIDNCHFAKSWISPSDFELIE